MTTAFLSLSDAVAAYVHDGDTVALEGFTHLIPHAAGHEIIRQRRKDLTLIRMTPDLIYDQLIGMGCAKKLVFSWGGNPGVGSLQADQQPDAGHQDAHREGDREREAGAGSPGSGQAEEGPGAHQGEQGGDGEPAPNRRVQRAPQDGAAGTVRLAYEAESVQRGRLPWESRQPSYLDLVARPLALRPRLTPSLPT